MRNPIVLVNPNTDLAVTAGMLAVAREAAGGAAVLEGMTVRRGAKLLTDEASLAVAEEAVVELAPLLADKASGVLVSAFGDPGVGRLSRLLSMPVVGIGEAAFREAAKGGRRFCVATTTPDMVAGIDRRAGQLGLGAFYAGTVLTDGDPVVVTGDLRRLVVELRAAIENAIETLGVEAVIIGGGPLAQAAAALAGSVRATIVQPVGAGVTALLAALNPSAQP